jgi:tetrahydromethanopterin S-methyltransferase subunit G
VAELEVTTGELYRSISALDGRVSAQFDSVNRRLDGLQFVHRETYAAEMAAIRERLEDQEEKVRWWSRAFVVSLLFPVVVGVILALVLTR